MNGVSELGITICVSGREIKSEGTGGTEPHETTVCEKNRKGEYKTERQRKTEGGREVRPVNFSYMSSTQARNACNKKK